MVKAMKRAVVLVLAIASAAVADPRPHKAPPPPTAKAKTEFKQHMKRGWAAQKTKQWAAAVPEFEAALVAVPADARALGELGFSAMNAGDFKKARIADEEAVAVAIDKKVKAAALYNLGTVLEKSGDKDGAVRAYLASVALRPNKTVGDAIVRLGQNPKAPAEVAGLACKPNQKPCACLKENAFTPHFDAADATCEEKTPAPLAGLHLWELRGRGSYAYLFDDAGRYVADAELDIDRMQGVEATFIDKVEKKSVGKHDVWWIWRNVENTQNSMSSTNDDDTRSEFEHAKLLTLCVAGDAKTPPRCPLVDVPVSRSVDVDVLAGNGKVTAKPAPAPTVLDVTVGTDGVATIKLKSGPSDDEVDALVGPHKLW